MASESSLGEPFPAVFHFGISSISLVDLSTAQCHSVLVCFVPAATLSALPHLLAKRVLRHPSDSSIVAPRKLLGVMQASRLLMERLVS